MWHSIRDSSKICSWLKYFVATLSTSSGGLASKLQSRKYSCGPGLFIVGFWNGARGLLFRKELVMFQGNSYNPFHTRIVAMPWSVWIYIICKEKFILFSPNPPWSPKWESWVCEPACLTTTVQCWSKLQYVSLMEKWQLYHYTLT